MAIIQSVSQSINQSKKIHCAYPFPPCLASIKFKDRFNKLSKAYWVFFFHTWIFTTYENHVYVLLRFVLQYFQVHFFIHHFWSIFVIFKEYVPNNMWTTFLYEKLRKYTHLSIQQENHQNNILRFRKLSHYGFKWRAFYKSVLPASIMRKLAKLALNCPKLSSKVITRLYTSSTCY